MPPDMPIRPENNFAFIDSTNLHLGIRAAGWHIDYRRFRTFLTDKYGVKRAYMFIGFDPQQQDLYRFLQESGYILEFKPALTLPNGKKKGNCDAELVLRCILDFSVYDRAVIVSGDGDFHCLVKHLKETNKLERIIAPSPTNCSVLLKRLLSQSIEIHYLNDQRLKLEYKKRSP